MQLGRGREMRGVEELLADIRVGRALRRRVHARRGWRGEERRVGVCCTATARQKRPSVLDTNKSKLAISTR